MARYIDAEKLLKECDEAMMYIQFSSPYQVEIDVMISGMEKIRDKINDAPTADVEEVKHGTWYHGMENGSVYAKCSACGRKMNYSCYGYARCSLCGAKMDGGKK